MACDDGKQFIRQVAVIPTHNDLFGREATLDDLIGLLKKYPVTEWLSYLARMQNMLVDTRAEQAERIRRVLGGTVSRAMRDKLEEFEKRCSGRMLLYYERQMSTLQQLAILHAPEPGTATLDNEEGLSDLSMALLMTMDVMGADRPLGGNSESLLSVILQDQIRMSMTPSAQYAARAFHFYELGRGQRRAEISRYLELFQVATGVSAIDCILGGLDIVAREETRGLDDIADAWYTIPRSHNAESSNEQTVLDACETVRMRPLAELRTLIGKWEEDRPVRDWNLIALSQAPICDLGDRGAFVLNHTALGRSLFDSVRHAILTAALEKRLPTPYDNKQAIGGLYGEIFESYIRSIFEFLFPGQVRRISEDKANQRADFLIWFPDEVIVVEVKGVHFVGKDHASFLSIDERREELTNVGMPHAIGQLGSTICALRTGDIIYAPRTEDVVAPSMPTYDWTITPIIPVIVTEEQMPQAPGCWDAFYAPLCAKFDELAAAGPLGKLRLLTVGDVERLPDLPAPHDLATMFIRWGADQSLRELTWGSFLAAQHVRFQGCFMVGRFADTLRFLARRLGLDETKLAMPATRQREQ
jgi:hypothetical protein